MGDNLGVSDGHRSLNTEAPFSKIMGPALKLGGPSDPVLFSATTKVATELPQLGRWSQPNKEGPWAHAVTASLS